MCKNWPDFPILVNGATGGLIGNTVMICGGNRGHADGYLDDCYSLNSQKATLITHMSVGRVWAASIVLNDNTLWVTGGYGTESMSSDYQHPLNSTEYITLNGTLPGPDLPTTLAQHTMVAINTTWSMVIAGTPMKSSYLLKPI